MSVAEGQEVGVDKWAFGGLFVLSYKLDRLRIAISI
jgi:hypothetical protein